MRYPNPHQMPPNSRWMQPNQDIPVNFNYHSNSNFPTAPPHSRWMQSNEGAPVQIRVTQQ